MKILQVIPNLLKGGAQRLVIDICNELINYNDVECKLIVLGKSKNQFSFCTSNIKIIYCKVDFKLSLFKANKINIKEYDKIVEDFCRFSILKRKIY